MALNYLLIITKAQCVLMQLKGRKTMLNIKKIKNKF